jgi:uncharacterized lipoprotein YehR (DUF1307 family)
MYNNMDEFVKTMEKAFEISKNIEGIDTIDWSLDYYGETGAVKEIAMQMNDVMQKTLRDVTTSVDGKDLA